MTYRQALIYYGSQAALAKAARVTLGAVKQWQRRGAIPEGRQCRLELATHGALRVTA